MAKKRGTGEGTVFQRADGRWVGTLSLGFNEQGQRIRKTIYGKTQNEVLEKLDDLKQAKKRGAKAVVGKDTVAGYLQRWLDDHVQLNKSGKTFVEYEQTVRLYISPFIGTIKLRNLSGEDLSHWQGKLARKEFTPNMRLRAVRILRNALNKAVKLKLIPFNPILAIDKPKVVRKEVIPLEPEQCHRLFEECKKYRLGELITLAVLTGLRKGELFALEWSAVNLSEGVLVVRRTLEETGKGFKIKEPKSASSKRVVSLMPEAIAALKERQKKAIAEGLPPKDIPLVFPSVEGGFLRGSNFDRRTWYPIRKAAGIPESFVFHDLRHTQASLLLAAGVDLKVIQKRLGHRDFSTTMNIYSHLLQGAQDEAVSKVSEFLKRSAPAKDED